MSSRAFRRLQEKELKNNSPAAVLNEEDKNENEGEEEVEEREEATNVIAKKKKKQKQKRINMFDLVSLHLLPKKYLKYVLYNVIVNKFHKKLDLFLPG